MGTIGVNNELRSEFLGFGRKLSNALEQQRAKAVTESDSRLIIEFQMEATCLSCLGSILARPDREFPIEQVQTKVRRVSIHSALMQGIHACHYCISNASYAQAGALVRQEIEGVEGLRGIRQGLQRDKETPRLKALRHLGRSYSQLTGLAHLSDGDILNSVVSSKIGSIDHVYNNAIAKHLLLLHVVALCFLIPDVAEMHPFSTESLFSSEEEMWFTGVCGWLSAEGILKPIISID